jgi:hypothetical protein
MRRHYFAFGFSLIETFIATLITSLSLLIGVHLVSRLSPQLSLSESAQSVATAELLVISLLKRSMRALDAHRLPLRPRIHENGSIHFNDGSAAPFGTDASPNSDALSYALVDSERVFIAASCQASSEVTRIHACLNSRAPKSFRDIVNFALVSPEGITLAPGTVRGGGLCRTLLLYPSSGILGDQTRGPIPCSVRAIVPVLSVETLYVGRDGVLRLVRYRGAKIIERQPVAEIPFRFLLTLSESPLGEFYRLDLSLGATVPASLGPASHVPRHFTFTHALSRRHYLDLVFNL